MELSLRLVLERRALRVARDLRRRVQEGRSIRYQTPRAVECYIQTQGLYRA